MSICATTTVLLTDGEDGIAKQLEKINAAIKQCVAFLGLKFTCAIFYLSYILQENEQ